MKKFKADLHIHTLLSPCGSLGMSPANIVASAKKAGMDIIGITDHNSTLQCKEVVRIGNKEGLTVFCGAEVTTREEAHCLAFFEKFDELDIFQSFLRVNLPDIKNVPDKFGDQVWVDENEMIAGEETKLLISALDASIEEVASLVHMLNGIFIPAHIDRPAYSVISQLGYIPDDIIVDALEIVDVSKKEMLISTYCIPEDTIFITSSDAHYLHQIGTRYTELKLRKPTFKEFRKFLTKSKDWPLNQVTF